jgi:hypothetical protein
VGGGSVGVVVGCGALHAASTTIMNTESKNIFLILHLLNLNKGSLEELPERRTLGPDVL